MSNDTVYYHICDECTNIMQEAEVDNNKCLECGGVNTVRIFVVNDPQPVRMRDAD